MILRIIRKCVSVFVICGGEMGKGVDLDGAECAAADPKFGEGSVDDKRRTDGQGCRRVEIAATRRQKGDCDGGV
jgi:hypothetical protein